MPATKLDLTGTDPAPPKPRRKPGPKRKTTTTRRKTASAGDVATGGPKRLWPAAADHVLALAVAFLAAATLTIWIQHQEIVAKAWAAAATDLDPRADYSDIWNQGHRWSQYVAGVLLAILTVTAIDRSVFTSVMFPEVASNRPLPGREHIFEPMSDVMRAGYLRFYGAVYGAAIIGAVIILGV